MRVGRLMDFIGRFNVYTSSAVYCTLNRLALFHHHKTEMLARAELKFIATFTSRILGNNEVHRERTHRIQYKSCFCNLGTDNDQTGSSLRPHLSLGYF
jgi:uncharacterized protein (DUF1786 family)